VTGTPVQQGNTKSAMVRGQRRTWHREGERLTAWRSLVALYAQASMTTDPWECPVLLVLDIRMPRPPSHLRKDGALRLRAPQHHTSPPDLDKLLRAVMDALTGVVYRDDAQVVRTILSKSYADNTLAAGASIGAYPISTPLA
jgi:crossover junction endodeoxyribonuclease RusA